MNNLPNYKYSELTSEIIRMAYYIHDYFGFGHLESVYEKSLVIKLRKEHFKVERQKSIKVYFEQELVGNFRADIVVEDRVILELKAVEEIHPIHEVQLVNYLKCTGFEVGLLFNFGEKLEFKRKVFSNDRKRMLKFIP
ncbi:MAG: GxxExxY protein [Bacteroidota bacterium]